MNSSIVNTSLLLFLSIILIVPTTAITINETSSNQIISKTIYKINTQSASLNPKINAAINQINRSLILNYLIPIVGFGPRLTGTYGCEKTADYIFDQFMSMNIDTRRQNWTALHTGHNLRNLEPRILKSQNIEGILHGNDPTSEKIIIFNAHYDTTKRSPGADDDGSGTAAVHSH